MTVAIFGGVTFALPTTVSLRFRKGEREDDMKVSSEAGFTVSGTKARGILWAAAHLGWFPAEVAGWWFGVRDVQKEGDVAIAL